MTIPGMINYECPNPKCDYRIAVGMIVGGPPKCSKCGAALKKVT